MLKPCAYTDIEWGVLYKYKNKEDIYVICSKTGNAYYFCKESYLEIILATLRMFDGKHSLKEIEESISKEYSNYKIDDMLMKLAYSKFVKGNINSSFASELRRSSINIKEFDISSIGRLKRSWVEFFYKFFSFLVVASIFICIYLFATNKIVDIGLSFSNFNIQEKKTLITILCILFSLLFHEFAHILVGLYYKLPPSKFGISLYMNIVPMYYITTPGIYLIGRLARIKYYIAGIGANFVLFAFFFMFGNIFHNDAFFLIAILNIQLILVNLMPFSLTDGYFLMTILLKKINLRLSFIDAITFRSKRTHKADLAVKIYSTISIVYIVVLSLNFSFWIVKGLNDYLFPIENYTFLTIIIAFFITVVIFLIMIRKTQKMNSTS